MEGQSVTLSCGDRLRFEERKLPGEDEAASEDPAKFFTTDPMRRWRTTEDENECGGRCGAYVQKRANLVQASLRSDGLEVAVLCETQIPHHRFDPHCLKVPPFAEPGNGKGVWQFL